MAVRRALLALVAIYRTALSPVAAALGARCRFHPTCSEYAGEALARLSPLRAICLIVRRLARCGPWCEGGVDHVPT